MKVYIDSLTVIVVSAVWVALSILIFGCTQRPSPDYKALYEQCQQNRVKCEEQRVKCLNVLLDCQGELK